MYISNNFYLNRKSLKLFEYINIITRKINYYETKVIKEIIIFFLGSVG